MIRINLLPPERRRPERTPLPRFVLILIGAGLATGIIVYLVLLGIKIGIENKTGSDLDTQLAKLRKDTSEYKEYKAEVDSIAAREKAIKALATRPVFWSEIVDALWTVINAQETMWVSEIAVMGEKKVGSISRNLVKSSGSKKAAGPPYGVRLKMNMYGDDIRSITKLRLALFENPLLRQYLPLMNPDPVYVRTPGVDGAPTVTTFEIVMIAPSPETATTTKGKPGS